MSSATHPRATCATHRDLLEAAATCEQALDRFPGEAADQQRARAMLTVLAGHCRSAAGVFTTDPTLADEPYGTGRFRALDLLAELVRQTRSLLRTACSEHGLDRWPRQARWEEVEALFARAAFFAELIPHAVPRHDHATEAGSRAISRDRLAAHARDLATAADTVRAALAGALRLPHPDPQALALAVLADQLTSHASTLAAHHEQRTDALVTACGLPGHRPEPGEQTAH